MARHMKMSAMVGKTAGCLQCVSLNAVHDNKKNTGIK